MKIQIDIKSAVCGLIVGVAAMFVMGMDSSGQAGGRYQIATGNSANGSGIVVMVDTQTGKAWGIDVQKDWNDNKADKFWGEK